MKKHEGVMEDDGNAKQNMRDGEHLARAKPRLCGLNPMRASEQREVKYKSSPVRARCECVQSRPERALQATRRGDGRGATTSAEHKGDATVRRTPKASVMRKWAQSTKAKQDVMRLARRARSDGRDATVRAEHGGEAIGAQDEERDATDGAQSMEQESDATGEEHGDERGAFGGKVNPQCDTKHQASSADATMMRRSASYSCERRQGVANGEQMKAWDDAARTVSNHHITRERTATSAVPPEGKGGLGHNATALQRQASSEDVTLMQQLASTSPKIGFDCVAFGTTSSREGRMRPVSTQEAIEKGRRKKREYPFAPASKPPAVSRLTRTLRQKSLISSRACFGTRSSKGARVLLVRRKQWARTECRIVASETAVRRWNASENSTTVLLAFLPWSTRGPASHKSHESALDVTANHLRIKRLHSRKQWKEDRSWRYQGLRRCRGSVASKQSKDSPRDPCNSEGRVELVSRTSADPTVNME
ncbi:hypothetical protein K438DRAFT_1772489 [Mycena galopus ATCC 62051]|nr:hypothetical protein K438DRAFT_1772489 [Mycena galopus ATCC 62051]